MSEPRTLLADAVQRLFRDAAAQRGHGDDGWDEALWRRIDEMGIPLLLAAEEAGGIGGGWEDAFVVLHSLGRHAIAQPVAEAMLAARLSAAAGLGSGPVSLSPRTSGRLDVAAAPGTALFSGEMARVPWGRDAKTIVGVLCIGGQCRVLVVERGACASMERRCNPAGEARDTLRFEAAPAWVAECNSPEARRLEEFCALARVCQIAGALEAALDCSLRHAKERSQFGKPLRDFQAVQQQLALLAAETAAVACAARAACRAADRAEASFEIAAAKLRANRAIDVAAAIAHQVHGAIGLTREYELRRATQRLWSWRTEFGNDRYWSGVLGEAVAARGPEAFWPDLTRRGDQAALAAP